MPDDALAPLNNALAANKTPHEERGHVDTMVACDDDETADEGGEARLARANAVIRAGIVRATATNTALGVLIYVRVSVMDGTPLLLQHRLLELAGLEITGKVQSIMRLPTGEILRLRNDDETGKLLIRFRRRTACDGGIALQPIDAFAPKHPDDVELQSDNGCEATIIPIELRHLLYQPTDIPRLCHQGPRGRVDSAGMRIGPSPVPRAARHPHREHARRCMRALTKHAGVGQPPRCARNERPPRPPHLRHRAAP